MTISKTRRTAIGAAIGTALTIAISTAAFTPVFADTTTADPAVTWSIADGATYLFGKVPLAVPTCAATMADVTVTAISCTVDPSTYLSTVGTHVLAATVTETLVDTSTKDVPASISYTVTPWTLKGFSSPVKALPAVNRIKGGSNVPLKFKVYEGTKKATSKTVVASILAQQVDCALAIPIGTPTSVTSSKKGLKLKYNDGAFHQNWKSPKLAVTKVKGKKTVTPACYAVTVTTQDASTLTASFLLK